MTATEVLIVVATLVFDGSPFCLSVTKWQSVHFIFRKSDMNRYSSLYRSIGGFGALEVLIVVATIALFAVVLLSGIAVRSSPKSARIACINNLKQIGLAVRMWSADNGDVFPWAAPISSNGVKELAFSGNVAALFLSMTNEILSSKILTCPSDSKRNRETNWVKLSNKNISYFIGLDVDERKPQTILSGDRNISGGNLVWIIHNASDTGYR